MSRLKNLLKKSLKSRTLIYDINSILIHKLGYADIDLAGANSKYRTFTSLKKKYKSHIGKTKFTKYKGDDKKRVWICWLQGIDNAPELVKNCYASVKHYIRDMEIVVLDKSNIKDYVNLPDYIYDKWEKGIIPNAQFSDLVRTELLIEHGGLWIDSTVYMTGELPSYITDSDFFVYHDGFFDHDMINMNNWLMYSEANNIILQETQNLLFEYWKTHNYMIHYFIMHMFFRMVTDYYPDEWKKVPYFNQIDQHILSTELYNDYDEKRFRQLTDLTSIHKLSNKSDYSKVSEKSYYAMLDRLYK
ncbi:MAG: capsular polysaccharide synthesis protein [Eubacterium sp.]